MIIEHMYSLFAFANREISRLAFSIFFTVFRENGKIIQNSRQQPACDGSLFLSRVCFVRSGKVKPFCCAAYTTMKMYLSRCISDQ